MRRIWQRQTTTRDQATGEGRRRGRARRSLILRDLGVANPKVDFLEFRGFFPSIMPALVLPSQCLVAAALLISVGGIAADVSVENELHLFEGLPNVARDRRGGEVRLVPGAWDRCFSHIISGRPPGRSAPDLNEVVCSFHSF